MAASPEKGVNTLTGEGLADALPGVSVVVDVSNAPSFEDTAVMEFFETSTRNLLSADAAAGVGHHVALSVVVPRPFESLVDTRQRCRSEPVALLPRRGFRTLGPGQL